jgi:predicted HTH domain antitoxin
MAIDVSEDARALLKQSRLATRSEAEQVHFALAVLLFEEGVISIGKAAELAGESRSSFEALLREMDIPAVRYDESDYAHDIEAIAAAKRAAGRT